MQSGTAKALGLRLAAILTAMSSTALTGGPCRRG
jgi:hypothetical protein